jgi:hypothetical protein
VTGFCGLGNEHTVSVKKDDIFVTILETVSSPRRTSLHKSDAP